MILIGLVNGGINLSLSLEGLCDFLFLCARRYFLVKR